MINDIINKYQKPQMKTGIQDTQNPMMNTANKYAPGAASASITNMQNRGMDIANPLAPNQAPVGGIGDIASKYGNNPAAPIQNQAAPTYPSNTTALKTSAITIPDVLKNVKRPVSDEQRAIEDANQVKIDEANKNVAPYDPTNVIKIRKDALMAKGMTSDQADAQLRSQGADIPIKPVVTPPAIVEEPIDRIVKKTLGEYATDVNKPFTEAGQLADEQTLNIMKGESENIGKMRQDFERRIAQRSQFLEQQARNQAAQMNLPVGSAGYTQLMDDARNRVDSERAQGFRELSQQAINERTAARGEGRNIENRVTNLATAERIYNDTANLRDKTDVDNLINGIEDQKTKQALLAAWATSNGDINKFREQLPNFIDPKTGELKQPGVSKQGAVFKDAQDRYAYQYYHTSWDNAVKAGLITDPDTEMKTKDNNGDGNPDFQEIYDDVLAAERKPLSDTDKLADQAASLEEPFMTKSANGKDLSNAEILKNVQNATAQEWNAVKDNPAIINELKSKGAISEVTDPQNHAWKKGDIVEYDGKLYKVTDFIFDDKSSKFNVGEWKTDVVKGIPLGETTEKGIYRTGRDVKFTNVTRK